MTAVACKVEQHTRGGWGSALDFSRPENHEVCEKGMLTDVRCSCRHNSGLKKKYSARLKRAPMLRQNGKLWRRSNNGFKKKYSARQEQQLMLKQGAKLQKLSNNGFKKKCSVRQEQQLMLKQGAKLKKLSN